MPATPEGPSDHTPRRRGVWIIAGVVVLVVVAVVVAGVAIIGGPSGDDGPTAAVVSQPGSYCGATATALAYTGHDPVRRSTLLAHVVALAPKDVAPVVREVRAARAGSPRAVAARHLWDYFNTNHCCDCHRATQPPEIAALTPAQRARIEAGEEP
jgi:hypothetical protein